MQRKLLTFLVILFFADFGFAGYQSWRPVESVDYWLIGGLLTATYGVSRIEANANPKFGGFLIDADARNILRRDSLSSRENFANFSDIGVGLAVSIPLIYSAGWLVYKENKSWLLFKRVSITSLQTLAFTGFWITTAKHILKRPRPYARECGTNPDYDGDCGTSDSQRSFFSGHAGLSFSGAGLVCYFQKNLKDSVTPVFRDKVCRASILLASSVAAMRMLADKHYFSDVLVGGLVGWTSGFYLPNLLHSNDSILSLAPVGNGAGFVFITKF